MFNSTMQKKGYIKKSWDCPGHHNNLEEEDDLRVFCKILLKVQPRQRITERWFQRNSCRKKGKDIVVNTLTDHQ